MTIRYYDLAGADDEHRFSPYCWRIKLALAHKGLAAESIPWRFTDKDAIAFSGQGKVPVLVDGETVLFDSWEIACYLEDAYPHSPSLFGGDAGQALALFIKHWAEQVLQPGIFPMVVKDIFDRVHPRDRDYFRRSREERLGRSLEEVQADREARLPAFRQSLEPLRSTLQVQPFLGGAHPHFADYIVFGIFQWARCVSPLQLLEQTDLVWAWRERLLDLFDGLARRAPGCGP
ncbi:MAG: glutathione S-transferase family protein [Candidatus Competibacteraceae bacterium]|nr:glutathione S-transferase family protein [Candidatus Competibacteraceae bacterium]